MKHLLSIKQFNRTALEELFKNADYLKTPNPDLHAHFRAAALFYEPSTRTRFSFESAAQDLGMSVISTENASLFS